MDSSNRCSSNQIDNSFSRQTVIASYGKNESPPQSTVVTWPQIPEPGDSDSKPNKAGHQILVSDILHDHLSGMIKRSGMFGSRDLCQVC